MLTRLRVRGFKNLHDFEMHFGPFTCIAGENGAGKSNLFDAIRFLHLLTQHSLVEAAQRLRASGDRSVRPGELLTSVNGYTADEMRFEADMIVAQHVKDDFGTPAEASTTALRYEVAFGLTRQEGFEDLTLKYESLTPMRKSDVARSVCFTRSPAFDRSVLKLGKRSKPFISMEGKGAEAKITVHQDQRQGRRKLVPLGSAQTMVGVQNTSDYPTVLAARREMEAWRTLMLEPSAMRAPSRFRDPQELDMRGANLPAALDRLVKCEQQPGAALAEIANRLAQLIEDIHELKVQPDAATETITLLAKGRDGVFRPAASLSDGTLRFLTLTTLALDPRRRGLVCLEEPENGIHPERLSAMVDLLKDIAVDPQDNVDDENPLAQVLVNTHSPGVVKHVALKEDLVFVEHEQRKLGAGRHAVAVAAAPGDTWRARLHAGESRVVPPGRMRRYFIDQLPSASRQEELSL